MTSRTGLQLCRVNDVSCCVWKTRLGVAAVPTEYMLLLESPLLFYRPYPFLLFLLFLLLIFAPVPLAPFSTSFSFFTSLSRRLIVWS